MDIEDVEAHVVGLVAELRAQQVLIAEGRRRASGLAKVIAGYVEMYPELESITGSLAETESDSSGNPQGAEAVRRVLYERPDYGWYVSEVVDALRDRGWLPSSDNPANAVRTTLERLVATADADVHKGRYDGKVVYSYRPDDPRPEDDPPTPTPAPPYGSYDEEPF